MNILITGATGFVGRALVDALLKKKHSVYCLVRNKEKARQILPDPNINLIEGDLIDQRCSYAKNLLSMEVVYHLAACVNSSLVKNFYEVNYEGTKHLINILKSSLTLKRFIYLSSIAVVGRDHKVPITEETPTNPFSPYGRSKLLAEAAVSNLEGFLSRVQIFIVRAPVVYGEGHSSLVSNFFNKILSGQLMLLGNGKNKRSMCYIKNLIFALSVLIDHKIETNVRRLILNVADTETKTLFEIIQSINSIAQNSSIKIRYFPSYISDIALLTYKAMVVLGYNSINLFTMGTVTANIDCDISTIKKLIGPPPYSLMEGLTNTVRWQTGQK